MKRHTTTIVIGCTLLAFASLSTIDQCEAFLRPKWRILGNTTESTIDFGGKWILVGSIIFKKKIKEPIHLNTLTLAWNGSHLDNLVASLYKKIPSKSFIPLEDNLVCDGVWNKTKQTLVFNFEEKETLHPTTIFYIVLTVPQKNESIIKKGRFVLEEQSLPQLFKQSLHTENLSLAIQETMLPSADKVTTSS